MKLLNSIGSGAKREISQPITNGLLNPYARLNQALQTWLGNVGYAAGLLLKSLRDKAEQWWYFLDDPSVPPDNNLAERSLRLAVTKRKVSGGSRSMARFEQTADLLSVIQTCRFQSRSAMAFFRQALSAHSCPFSLPSLLPFFQP